MGNKDPGLFFNHINTHWCCDKLGFQQTQNQSQIKATVILQFTVPNLLHRMNNIHTQSRHEAWIKTHFIDMEAKKRTSVSHLIKPNHVDSPHVVRCRPARHSAKGDKPDGPLTFCPIVSPVSLFRSAEFQH